MFRWDELELVLTADENYSATKREPLAVDCPAGHLRSGFLIFPNPLPTLRCPATFEAWQDSTTREILKP